MSYDQHCSKDKRNLRLLWEDIVRKKQRNPQASETCEEETPPHSVKMKMENKEVRVRNYYRLCSG